MQLVEIQNSLPNVLWHVIHAPAPPRRTISECIALPPEDSTAVMDADLAKDVEAAIESHCEPLEPPSWE